MKTFVAFESSPWNSWGVIGVGSTYENARLCVDKHHEEWGHRSKYTIGEFEVNAEPICFSPSSTPLVKPRTEFKSKFSGEHK